MLVQLYIHSKGNCQYSDVNDHNAKFGLSLYLQMNTLSKPFPSKELLERVTAYWPQHSKVILADTRWLILHLQEIFEDRTA